MGLYADWVVRSGGPALAIWQGGPSDRMLVPATDESGAVIMSSSEMIVDFLLQVCEQRRANVSDTMARAANHHALRVFA